MTQKKEELLLKNRLVELAKNAYYKGLIHYTGFLNLNDQNILFQSIREMEAVKISSWGGYELAERKMFAFEPKECYEEKQYPLCAIKVEVINRKFSDELTHRDYLGAILNLGIDRSKIGDILVEFPKAYVFCEEKIAGFLVDSLMKVKHTQVRVTLEEPGQVDITPKFQEIEGSVSSLRLDALLPVALKGSRSRLSGLIAGEKVYVNGRLVTSSSYIVKEEDVVSVRGFGKFIFKEIVTETKKGRFYILIYKYV